MSDLDYLSRLDLLVENAEYKLNRAIGDEALVDLFPQAIERLQRDLDTFRWARKVADPDFVFWVAVSDRAKAHAVRTVPGQPVCGREFEGIGTVDPDRDRCKPCLAELGTESPTTGGSTATTDQRKDDQ